MRGQATGVIECSPEQHLDVSIQAAELVVGPAHQGVVDCRVDPEQDLTAVTHV
jgi:hypothetical protein